MLNNESARTLAWEQKENDARLLHQAQILDRVSACGNKDEAMAFVSKLAGFPLPVTMGAVLTTLEMSDTTEITLPTMDELSGFPSRDQAVMQHTHPA